MIEQSTLEGPKALSFMTAPPVMSPTSERRFRAGRNQPYRDAEPYKSSIYYWWWAFLKRSAAYRKTCNQLGQGKLVALYQDFGNVFESDFLPWWNSHQALFAEQASKCHDDNYLLYQIDPSRPLSQITEEIKALHMQAHAIMPTASLKSHSNARYPIYANVSAHTLHKVLTIWDLRSANPDASAYDLGVLAGYKANLIPDAKYGATRTRTALDAQAHNKRARISIANQANRYLRTAEQYIDNVALGEFPKATRR